MYLLLSPLSDPFRAFRVACPPQPAFNAVALRAGAKLWDGFVVNSHPPLLLGGGELPVVGALHLLTDWPWSQFTALRAQRFPVGWQACRQIRPAD